MPQSVIVQQKYPPNETSRDFTLQTSGRFMTSQSWRSLIEKLEQGSNNIATLSPIRFEYLLFTRRFARRRLNPLKCRLSQWKFQAFRSKKKAPRDCNTTKHQGKVFGWDFVWHIKARKFPKLFTRIWSVRRCGWENSSRTKEKIIHWKILQVIWSQKQSVKSD